jgi:hypothetical protein
MGVTDVVHLEVAHMLQAVRPLLSLQALQAGYNHRAVGDTHDDQLFDRRHRLGKVVDPLRRRVWYAALVPGSSELLSTWSASLIRAKTPTGTR